MTDEKSLNIVLIGFMGTGKSAVGQALAQHLGWHYLDTDAEIEREAGRTIPQIFADEGEKAFRQMETAFLNSPALQHWDGGDLILSTGGGTPLLAENAALLKQIGAVVWLQASAEAILTRVGPGFRSRPLLASYQEDPRGRIESLLSERAPRYAALADYSFDTSESAGPEEVGKHILDLLASRKE